MEDVGSAQMDSSSVSVLTVFQVLMSFVLLEKYGFLLSSPHLDEILIKTYDAPVVTEFFDGWCVESSVIPVVVSRSFKPVWKRDSFPIPNSLPQSAIIFVSYLDLHGTHDKAFQSELNELVRFVFSDSSLNIHSAGLFREWNDDNAALVSSEDFIHQLVLYGIEKKWLKRSSERDRSTSSISMEKLLSQPGIQYNFCSYCFLFATGSPFVKSEEGVELLERTIDQLKSDLLNKMNPSKTLLELEAVQEMSSPSTSASLAFIIDKAREFSR
ncbi:hypothetical protein Gasu2_34250 [Galdieria sulphuraria]|nr:hypothetical protein Gasu2_34250 [Galdieria sulphuraria]